eukprot:UN28705
MDSPGGYQLVGRTLPIWNSFGTKNNLFNKETPWLLRMFDQVKFYPVTPEELDEHRAGFQTGLFNIKVENTNFNLKEYNKMIEDSQDEINEYKKKQRKPWMK